MLSIPKIINYVKDDCIELSIIKDYFETGSEILKGLNERSIKITRIIIILVIVCLFQSYFSVINISDNKIDIKFLRLVTPTLISYLLFEWLMMAKRRRDLIFGIQQASYKLFKINPTVDEAIFPSFNPNTLNVMPYSFMCEVLSIDDKTGYNRTIYRYAVKLIFIILIVIMCISFYGYWNASKFQLSFQWPSSFQILVETISFYSMLLVTILFTGWISYYYRTEFRNMKEIIQSTQSGATEQ